MVIDLYVAPKVKPGDEPGPVAHAQEPWVHASFTFVARDTRTGRWRGAQN
jgi:hypothetical protein